MKNGACSESLVLKNPEVGRLNEKKAIIDEHSHQLGPIRADSGTKNT
jgi:hypothetical protein